MVFFLRVSSDCRCRAFDVVSTKRKGNAKSAVVADGSRANVPIRNLAPLQVKTLVLADKKLARRIAAQDAVGQMGDMQTRLKRK